MVPQAEAVRVEQGMTYGRISVPNLEVSLIWRDPFLRWMEIRCGALEPLHAAVLGGDASSVDRILARMLRLHVSHHDVAADQDEVFYRAFVLGLFVTLEKTHAVRSNREVGDGRADVQLIPKRPGLPGGGDGIQAQAGDQGSGAHRVGGAGADRRPRLHHGFGGCGSEPHLQTWDRFWWQGRGGERVGAARWARAAGHPTPRGSTSTTSRTPCGGVQL